MEECSIVGIDLAKNVFQVRASDQTGRRLFSGLTFSQETELE